MAEPTKSGGSPGRVLVVEDDPGVRDSLEAILSSDYETTTVGSVAAATKLLAPKAWDVVVTDFNLGDGNGSAVIEAARERCPEAAVILLTGQVDYSGVRALQKSGRVLVLFKPVNPDELLAWVKNGVTMARLSAATNRLAARAKPASDRVTTEDDTPAPRKSSP